MSDPLGYTRKPNPIDKWLALGVILAVIGFIIVLTSCGPTIRLSTPGTVNKDQMVKQLIEKADSAGKTADQLRSEKADLVAKLEANRQEEKALAAAIVSKDKQIGAEQVASAQTRLYWFAGISIALALASVAVAIFVPLVSTWAIRFGLTCIGLAALSVFVAKLIPYLIFIGAGIAAVGLGYGILWWYRDHKTARQVIAAIEPVKHLIPDYAEHFAQYIDENADRQVDRIRDRYGIRTPVDRGSKQYEATPAVSLPDPKPPSA